MSGFITQQAGNAALAAPGENAPADAYPSSVWDSQDWFGATKQLGRGMGAAAAMYGATDEYGRQVSPPEPYVDAAELNKRYGITDHLRFDNPLPESVASSMYDAKRDELGRESAAGRSDAGGLARFGAGLVSGVADPLNIAAAFVPVVSEARVAGLLARAGIEGGAGAALASRALTGAAGALTAQVPLTALRYGLSRQEQADYSATDAMADIVMGGLIGGGLHTAIGGAGDFLGSRFARSPVFHQVEDSPAAREAAVRAAVAQMAQDQPVNLAPVLDTTALRSAYADRLAARGDTAAGNYAAFGPDGTRLELRPEIVEANSLITSHNDDGSVNPAYPHESGMQGRDRQSLASQEQVTRIASRIEPELLGPNPDATTGAPILNAANQVEGGNGRTMAIRRMYADPALSNQAAAYRAFLEARGYDTSGMQAPMLIGRRMNDLTPDQVRSYTRNINERGTLGMNSAETARSDAERAARAIDSYQPGTLYGSANRDFVARFMTQLPIEERGGMMLKGGPLSIVGEARIRAALLAHAYGDALGPTLDHILNGDVEGMKGVAGALTDNAGMWGKMRVAAEAGEIPAGLDITPAIGEAVQMLDRAHETGTPIGSLLAQSDMMGGPSPAAEALLRLMFRDEAMRQPVARAKLASLLDSYAKEALQAKPGNGMLGGAETTPADIFRAIGKDDSRMEAAATGLETAAEEISPPRPEAEAKGPPPKEPAHEISDHDAADTNDLFGGTDQQTEARSVPTATIPAELSSAIEGLTREFDDARAAGRLDPEVDEALAQIEDEAAKSQGLLDACGQAASCILGGLI